MSGTGTATSGLCVSAVLLYIGLSLLVDPEGAARVSDQVAGRLRDFDLALRGFSALNRLSQPAHAELSPATRFRIRLAGLALAALAFLCFVLVIWQ
jgi:hypothetical protein